MKHLFEQKFETSSSDVTSRHEGLWLTSIRILLHLQLENTIDLAELCGVLEKCAEGCSEGAPQSCEGRVLLTKTGKFITLSDVQLCTRRRRVFGIAWKGVEN